MAKPALAKVDFEKLPLDVKTGVEFLRRQPGIAKVVLFAHSGGGPLMSASALGKESAPHTGVASLSGAC
jgi:hypothetical protein